MLPTRSCPILAETGRARATASRLGRAHPAASVAGLNQLRRRFLDAGVAPQDLAPVAPPADDEGEHLVKPGGRLDALIIVGVALVAEHEPEQGGPTQGEVDVSTSWLPEVGSPIGPTCTPNFYTEAAVGVAVRPARHGFFDLVTDLKNDHPACPSEACT